MSDNYNYNYFYIRNCATKGACTLRGASITDKAIRTVTRMALLLIDADEGALSAALSVIAKE